MNSSRFFLLALIVAFAAPFDFQPINLGIVSAQEYEDEDFESEEFSDQEFSEDDFEDELSEAEFEDEDVDFEDDLGSSDFANSGDEEVQDDIDDFSDFDDIEDSAEESVTFDEELEGNDAQASEEFNEALEPALDASPSIEAGTETFEEMAVSEVSNLNSSPNLQYEQRLFNLYNEFYKFPVSPNDWSDLTGDRTSEVYAIQKGDTLWDISATFFGDGNYWPKIWSVNGRITNPHLIDPGNNILFNLGTLSGPPQFAVTSENGEQTESEAEDVTSKDNSMLDKTKNAYLAANGDLKIPPPQIKRNPLLNIIPNSIPRWNYAPAKDVSMDHVRVKQVPLIRKKVPLQFMIKEKKIIADGVVLEAEATEKLAIAGQYVYAEFKLNPGSDRYLVVENMGLANPGTRWGDIKGPFGYSYKVLGEIALSGEVSVKGKKNIYRAYVETALSPIQQGAQLVPMSLVKFTSPTSSGEFNLARGQVIGGSFSRSSKVLYKGMFAFINKGESAGLQVDDRVTFSSNRNITREFTLIEGQQIPIGEGLVVDTTQNLATVYIYRAQKEILAGDYIGESGNAVSEQSYTSSSTDSTDDFGEEGDAEFDESDFNDDQF